MNVYEKAINEAVFEGVIVIAILLATLVLPVITIFLAAYRQHSRWTVLPYAAIATLFVTFVQSMGPRNRGTHYSLHLDAWLEFLILFVVIVTLGGIAFLSVRAIGKHRRKVPAPKREQLKHLIAFAGLFTVGFGLSYGFEVNPFL